MAKKENITNQPPRTYSLQKAIQGRKQGEIDGEAKLYKANIKTRDAAVRRYVKENLKLTDSLNDIMPGQLVMFDYFTPKTAEELEYYDAMPCTIFFGTYKTDDGPRVIGFNIHYYPPKLRYRVMDKVFDIYRNIYVKTWNDPLKKRTDLSGKMLMYMFKQHHLEFGIRQYIPDLMARMYCIPAKDWQKAVFTEGRFKKRTRDQILKYWRDLVEKTKK